MHMVGDVLRTEAHAHSGRGADTAVSPSDSLGLAWAPALWSSPLPMASPSLPLS